MKKVVIGVIVVISLLLLNSCTTGFDKSNPQQGEWAQENAYTGTRGVELTFDPQYPPITIYDNNPLIMLIKVQNQGSYSLNAGDCFIKVSGFDPNIIRGGFNTMRSCAENVGGVLEGKSAYSPEGEINLLEFKSDNIRLPTGTFKYNPFLNIVSCYNYKVTASPLVCVDPQSYNYDPERKTCIPKDVSVANGQGGPVGVSNIKLDMAQNQAIFEITVNNYDSGVILSPNIDLRSCDQNTLGYDDYNKVRYDVQLSGGTKISCSPQDGMVRMSNNIGKILCKFQINEGSAFETPLTISLDYGYKKSYQKQINIIKTPE
jgi:hypothetical protein